MEDNVVEDLKSLLKGTLSREGFLKKANEYPSQIQDLLVGNIDHFLDDADIRAKDAVYKNMQESEMQKLIALFEAGGPEEKIRRINFLGSTEG